LAQVRAVAGEEAVASGRLALVQAAADGLDALPPGQFDVVLLNSVVQYFPDERYLRRVVEQAVRRVRPGGRLVVGDVRSLPLHAAHEALVEVLGARPDRRAAQAADRVRARCGSDEELLVAPQLFTSLVGEIDQVRRVRVLPEHGDRTSETGRFRYNVVVEVGPAADDAVADRTTPAGPGDAAGAPWQDWRTGGWSIERLERVLRDERPAVLPLDGVPNARTAAAAELGRLLMSEPGASTVDALWEQAQRTCAGAVDPDDLAAVADALGYRAAVDWSGHGADGDLRVVLRSPAGAEVAVAAPPDLPAPAALTNHNGRGRVDGLRSRWGAALSAVLPGYMVPSAYVLLDGLPLTANGKVDRRNLPAPAAGHRDVAARYVPPRTALETVLATIWAEVLDLDQVGVEDDFFDLGGHSLLSTRVVARLRDLLGVEVPVRRVFSESTVAGLAVAIARSSDGPAATRTAELLLEVGTLSDEDVLSSLDTAVTDGGAA
ncbi:MAG TPA: phosphopantetheine-binding protein, partial [Cellulomonas sp.]